MSLIYFDGQYQKVNREVLEVFTPGVFRAHGVFETLLGVEGVVMDVASHIKRLRLGAHILRIKIPALDPVILQEVFRRNALSVARVRVMVWQALAKVHLMIVAVPYQKTSKPLYRVCLVQTDRACSKRFADVKSLDYEVNAQAYAQARHQGAQEALLLNRQGYVFEASRANVFWMKDKVLYTPPLSSGCLNGITRQQVLRHATRLKLAVKEKLLLPETLQSSDAAFLTNSLIGIQAMDTRRFL